MASTAVAVAALAAAAGAFAPRPRVGALLRARSQVDGFVPPPDDAAWIAPGKVVAAADEHGQYYDATVLELRTRADGGIGAAFVQFIGWEDWPSEWVARESLAYLPPRGAPPVDDAALSPEALAERRRVNRRSQDCWQFDQFTKAFAGSWRGAGERYVAAGRALTVAATFDGSLDLERRDDATVASAHDAWALAVSETRTNFVVLDSLGDGAAEPAREAAAPPLGAVTLKPATFRAEARDDGELGGTAANGEAFSTARVDGDALVVDVWARAADYALSLRVAYEKTTGGAWAFACCDLARWCPAGGAAAPAGDALGTGLYDVHRRLRDMATRGALDESVGIHELRLPGRVTAAFPRTLDPGRGGRNANGGGVVSLDLVAGDMRIQVDRVFDTPLGDLASFEITDILVDDAEKFPAKPVFDD